MTARATPTAPGTVTLADVLADDRDPAVVAALKKATARIVARLDAKKTTTKTA